MTSITSLSTYAAFQSTMSDVSSVESTLQTEQIQLSSGNASQSYTQMGSQSQQYLSLNDAISQTSQFINTHQAVEANINSTSQILGQVITMATSLRSLISQQTSGVSNNADFATQLQGQWQTLVGLVNTQMNGQYLFSGSRTDTPPVNASTYPTLINTGVPDTSYYQGGSQNMTMQVDSQNSLTYNVRADSPAFQQLFAGLAMAQSAVQDGGSNSTTLQQAQAMVESAIGGITTVQAHVGAIGAQLTASDTALQGSKTYLQGLQQTIGNTDILAVSTLVSQNQGILQAAFEAFSKISQLNLTNYLK